MGPIRRFLAGIVGALLLFGGVYVLAYGVVDPIWRYLAGIAFIVLGVNALHGAATGREPWILKVGPLP